MNQILLLASQSPRRRELLEQIGVQFSVITIDVPEQYQQGESAQEYVQRLSLSKARTGAKQNTGFVVLGADTIVVCDGQILEKPSNKAQAVDMLLALSGNRHEVYTAVSLCCIEEEGKERVSEALCRSEVLFRDIARDEAERYWNTGEPQDKAGSYGIQGKGAVFVARLNGSYSNVVGLPLLEVQQLLNDFGISVWDI